MDGLSHYLQSSTQGAMIVPSRTTTKQTKLLTQQQQDDCEPPQYFSNSMSVLPADRYGSYYIIYHRDVSGECRDDEAALLTNHTNNNGNNIREGDGVQQQDHASTQQVRTTAPKPNVKFAGTKIYERKIDQRRPPAISMMQDDDDDEYDYYEDGCASHAAEACVASSIPVLHFIQFFMC